MKATARQLKTKSTSSQRRYRAPALDKGLDILEYLADERLPLTQLEVAAGLGRTSGEIYRMLMCLEERGYVIREAESGKFRLTLRLYELGHKQNTTMLLRRSARLPMELLAEETGQACHLSVQYGCSLLTIMERMPPRHICLAVGEGTVLPLVETTSGKVLLSRMEPKDAIQLLQGDPYFAAMSEPHRRVFLKNLEKISAATELVSQSGTNKAVTDIAIPVGIQGTDTFAVLTVCHLAEANTDSIRAAALRCAGIINKNLGTNLSSSSPS